MITRVTIHVESKNLHFCEIFTDEETLTKECDEWLDSHDLNDGCSGFTTEEVIALNSILAEKFDDPYNADHYVCCDELYGTLEDAVRDKIHHYGYDEEQLLKIAEILEIDPKQL